MNDFPDGTTDFAARRPHDRRRLAVLLCFHIVLCCLSLIFVAAIYWAIEIVKFDKTHLFPAVLSVALFAAVSVLFIFSRFSFGYFGGFYLYTMILGYLWLVAFSRLPYDHTLAAVSAFASAIAFLLPALFITAPIRQRLVLSARAMENLLTLILILAAAVIAAGALHSFRLVGLDNMYDFRDEIDIPAWLKYAIGAMSNALLPFAFACFMARGNRWRAAAALLLMLLFYPITLTKLAQLPLSTLTAGDISSTGDEIHVAAYKSYHTTTPNGFDVQISAVNHDTRLTLPTAVTPKRPPGGA